MSDLVTDIQNRIKEVESLDELFTEVDLQLYEERGGKIMKLELKRKYFKDDYTIGHLFVDGVFFCDTLEDPYRKVKISTITGIPTGRYQIIINDSIRFKRRMPLLLNVPGFEGIRIHPGNSAVDTSGCILVGENKAVGRLINSRVAFDNLFNLLNTTEGALYIVLT